jgi:hypothetical protein
MTKLHANVMGGAQLFHAEEQLHSFSRAELLLTTTPDVFARRRD